MAALTRLNEMQFARYLGFEFLVLDGRESVVELVARDVHENSFGRAHGGVIPAIIDAAGATAVAARAGTGTALTADLRVNYIRAIQTGNRIRAVGRVSCLSGSTGFADVQVTNNDNEIVALGQVTCILKA